RLGDLERRRSGRRGGVGGLLGRRARQRRLGGGRTLAALLVGRLAHLLTRRFSEGTAVGDELLDGDHRQAVLVGKLAQRRPALHRAIVVDELDDQPDRRQAGEAGEVHGGLGVAAALEDATCLGTQRQYV